MISLFIALSAMLNLAQAMPEVNYSAAQRIEYLQNTLSAFQQLDMNFIGNTQQLLRSQNRYACSAQAEQLRIQCLMQQATSNCENSKKKLLASCSIVSDVIVNNLIEENTFINKHELLKILRNQRGSRDQLLSAINGRYARITVEFLQSLRGRCKLQDKVCLAQEIDRFCLKKANQQTLAWQGCAGAVVWFIGSNQK